MDELIADRVDIVYYTDPLCCWSWAMEPQWRRLRYEFKDVVRWRYCMGGLLPGWKHFHDPVNSVSRPAQLGPVWMEAAHLSGMPVNSMIWVHDPPSSSYLSCIAFKCAQKQSDEAGEKFLRMLREAVMMKGINMTLQTKLVQLAEELSDQHPGLLDLTSFKHDMEDGTGMELFRSDLNEVKIKNIKRFPTLIFRRQGHPSLLLSGYRPYSFFMDIMKKIAPDFNKIEVLDKEAYKAFWGATLEREEKELQ